MTLLSGKFPFVREGVATDDGISAKNTKKGKRGGRGGRERRISYLYRSPNLVSVSKWSVFFSNLLVTFTLLSKEKGITIKQKKISKWIYQQIKKNLLNKQIDKTWMEIIVVLFLPLNHQKRKCIFQLCFSLFACFVWWLYNLSQFTNIHKLHIADLFLLQTFMA